MRVFMESGVEALPLETLLLLIAIAGVAGMIDAIAGGGGLLALPVRDTMKRQVADSTPAAVAATVERDNLWHALTPQYFPAIKLKIALENALRDDLNITDESSSMELAGYSPILVHGHEDNIKITRPDDLRLAGLYLQAQTDTMSTDHE